MHAVLIMGLRQKQNTVKMQNDGSTMQAEQKESSHLNIEVQIVATSYV